MSINALVIINLYQIVISKVAIYITKHRLDSYICAYLLQVYEPLLRWNIICLSQSPMTRTTGCVPSTRWFTSCLRGTRKCWSS